MSNVLGDDKQQQILALGRLGWSLRRIEEATGVRRETASAYLKAAGIAVRGRGRRRPSGAKTGQSEVSTDSGGPTGHHGGVHRPGLAARRPSRAPSASACEPYRELIVAGARPWAATRWRSGRTWSTTTASPRATRASGASSLKLRGSRSPEARVGDHDGARRRRPGRLRRRADGPRSGHRASTGGRGSSS